jgi:hypothetical protein
VLTLIAAAVTAALVSLYIIAVVVALPVGPHGAPEQAGCRGLTVVIAVTEQPDGGPSTVCSYVEAHYGRCGSPASLADRNAEPARGDLVVCTVAVPKPS